MRATGTAGRSGGTVNVTDDQQTDSFMVIVADTDDETSGDIAFFRTVEESAAHVESLLEAGYQQERIGVFGIEKLSTHVRHRPVVTIIRDEPAPATEEEAATVPEQEASPAPAAE